MSQDMKKSNPVQNLINSLEYYKEVLEGTEKVKSFGCKPFYFNSKSIGRFADDIKRAEINLHLGCRVSSLEALGIQFLANCIGIEFKNDKSL